MQRLIRRAIFGSSGDSKCKILLDTAKAVALGHTAANLLAGQGFQVTVPGDPAPSATYAANTSLAYAGTTNYDGPRILVQGFTTVVADSGVPFVTFWIADGARWYKLYYDFGINLWRYLTDTGASSAIIVDESSDPLSQVLLRNYPNGDWEILLGESVALSGSGAAGFATEDTIQVIYGLEWDAVTSPAAGIKLEGYVYSNVTDPIKEIENAQPGDYNWCGTEFFVAELEEPAASQLIAPSSNVTFAQRHSEINILLSAEEEAAANQAIALNSDTTFLQRHQEISTTETTEEEAAANQTLVASSNVTFMQRHQETT